MLPNCSCGACCEQCGHTPDCVRFDNINEENE